MDPITEAVTAAIEDAQTADPTPDATSEPAASASADPAPAAAAAEPVSPSSTAATEPAAPVAEPPDPTEALLEQHGIKPPMEGQRENRIPYSRVRKIIDGALKKQGTAHEGEVAPLKEKLSKIEPHYEALARAEQLMTQDPDQFMTWAARADPRFQRYLDAVKAPPVAAAQPAAPKPGTDDPMPAPDAQYPDGSAGYSHDQHQKLMDWNRRQAVREAREAIQAENEKRYGPLEAEWRARKTTEALIPTVKAKQAALEKTWGPLLKTHEAEIVAALQADRTSSVELIVQRVLVPHMQTDRTKMREEVRRELSARPAAAARTAPAPAPVAAEGPRTLEDVIREQIASVS